MSTPEEKDGERQKALSYVKPSGTPIYGVKRDLEVMAQQTCYADSPVMPLPCADKDLTG